MIGSFFAINVVAPMWMQLNLGWNATWAGNATGLIGILAIVAAPISAQLTTKVDPRKLIFLGVMWLAFVTFMRSLGNTDMSFGSIAIWIFLAGAGMPFFFMPLISISMGAVRPEETASASGLQNFIRTMAGAIATSFVTTAWENAANANHNDLVNIAGGGGGLTGGGGGMGDISPDAMLSLFDRLIQGQSVMLATNQIFFGASIVFVCCAFMAWTLPRPKGPVDMSGAH
jgi:DHA2 family multidrug resistance protein